MTFVNDGFSPAPIRLVFASSDPSSASMDDNKDDGGAFMISWPTPYAYESPPFSCDLPAPDDVWISALPPHKAPEIIDPARVYPSPPLTDSELKRTIPLPMLQDHTCPMNGARCIEPPPCHDGTPCYIRTPSVTTFALPLSPPDTLSVLPLPLPDTEDSSPHDDGDEDDEDDVEEGPGLDPDASSLTADIPAFFHTVEHTDEGHADPGSGLPGAPDGSALLSRPSISSHLRTAAVNDEGEEGDREELQDAQAARAPHVLPEVFAPSHYKASHQAPSVLCCFAPPINMQEDQAGSSTGWGTGSSDGCPRASVRWDIQMAAKHPLPHDMHPEDTVSPSENTVHHGAHFGSYRAEKRMRFYSEGQLSPPGSLHQFDDGATLRRSYSEGMSESENTNPGHSGLYYQDFPSQSSLFSSEDGFPNSPMSSFFDTDDDVRVREPDEPPPASPRGFLSSLPGLYDDNDAMDVDEDSFKTYPWDAPPSPSLHTHLDLFDDDDVPEVHSPSSPSRRLTAPLPEDDDIHIDAISGASDSYSPPGSPRLLSFPGVETDDSLIQPEIQTQPELTLSLSRVTNTLGLSLPIAPASTDPMDLVDTDAPPNLDFSPAALARGDAAELTRLLRYRRRTWVDERRAKGTQAAWAAEARRLAVPLQANILVPGALNLSVPGALPDFDEKGWASGDISEDAMDETADEAMQTPAEPAAEEEETRRGREEAVVLAKRRRELQNAEAQRAAARDVRRALKVRGKEIEGLLMLKLGETPGATEAEGPAGEEGGSAKRHGHGIGKVMFTSIPSLVARMTLKRRDTQRPLSHRKTARAHVASPLSRAVTSAADLPL